MRCFVTVHFETKIVDRTILVLVSLLSLKSDSLLNVLLTKSIQHEGKGFENSENIDHLLNSLN